jgi:signal transduction histidine kinase
MIAARSTLNAFPRDDEVDGGERTFTPAGGVCRRPAAGSARSSMMLRLGSLKTRTAAVNAGAVALVLIANGGYLVISERAEIAEMQRNMEEHALLFAHSSRAPLSEFFARYAEREPTRFHELVRTYAGAEPSLQRVRLAASDGRVLFDSAKPAAEPRDALGAISDPRQLAALRGDAIVRLPGERAAGDAALQIVVPEAHGQPFAILFDVSFESLQPLMRRRLVSTLLLVLASIAAAVAVSLVLASRITRPIEELTKGALEMGEGNFDRRLEVAGGGNDEIRALAETFSQMAGRLKENIAQLEESNRRLAGLNEELKELDRVKSDLLANVSHELRTPLTAIKGYTDYILDGKLGPISDKQERGLLVIQRNLERLSRSINALLDFSTMDVGRISLNLQPLSLQQLIEQIQQTLRSELERKQLRFLVELPPGLPQVIADRDKLAQVLENLVINAIKFTPAQGSIAIRAARDDSRGPRAVEVVVRDSGIGIPQDQIGKIFNRFHQVDSSTTRRFGGVGLGLAIVKSILDAHGASIKVESEEGRGTAFRFWLPAIEREDAQVLPGDIRRLDA